MSRLTLATLIVAAFAAAALFAQENAKNPKKAAPPAQSKEKAKAETPRDPTWDDLAKFHAQSKGKAKAETPADDPIAQTLATYGATFAKNDAQALAALWTEGGVYIDRETGERTTGREALAADFEKVFKEKAGVRLSAELTSKRLIKPDVAAIEGVARIVLPGEEPADTTFSAILVKEGDQWLFDSVEEISTPVPATSRDALADLEWMIGHWVDEASSGRVNTTVRWGANETFLVRTFVAQLEDGETPQGTQVIGWDPRLGQIRSWSFFYDGSFGEGFWSKNGDEWHVKSTQTLDDGTLASGTQVIKRIDDNTVTVQTLGRELNGEPAPAEEPVTVVRTPEADGAKAGDENAATDAAAEDQAAAKSESP